MRVLLISPVQELDPPGGDVTYTHLLLNDPPDGVIYESYEQALKRGTLREHGRWLSLKSASSLSNFFFELFLWSFSRMLNFARQARILFWEPFRFYSIQPGAYDLVHLHMFGVRFFARDCPLVVSNSISHHYLYKDARSFSRPRLAVLEAIEQSLCRLLKVVHPSYRIEDADHAIAFNQYMKDWYTEQALFPSSKIEVLPPYSLKPKSSRRADIVWDGDSDYAPTIGFVAHDFDVKGGPDVLRAFELVRERFPQSKLHIVGTNSRISSEEAHRKNIRWEVSVDRETLLNEIMPTFTVFAYPTNFDGLPLILLDAMSLGIPTVCSDYPTITELVEHEVDGLICGSRTSRELADKIIALLEPAENERYSSNILNRFEQRFSSKSIKPKLKDAYSRALNKVPAISKVS